ncbi:hypothetical protein AKJ43_02185 [candidate division MSBL1 archaeon SCGC-AAA261D19]|uniref:Uncharacterized protein n=1 Tax=candidate division MSBL1 archaeon SCGC-AAA261D19 TaxID=1698273 RepID=A0A133V6Z6_9EURY|nr:hypothetical protein AKJ43_02185 [candidate division MSBL1 archaeon SCGC-AAA261D19]
MVQPERPFPTGKGCLEGAKVWIRGAASVGTSDYCTYWGRLLAMRGEGPFSSKMALKPIEDLQRSNAVEKIRNFRPFAEREIISTIKHKFREWSEAEGNHIALLRTYFLFTGVVPFNPERQAEGELKKVADRVSEGIRKGDGWSPLLSQFRKALQHLP